MLKNGLYESSAFGLLSHCSLCPRNCGADRFSENLGYCKCDATIRVSSICVHTGEEPVISGAKGICNIFFPHCTMQCLYCQNNDISNNGSVSLPVADSLNDLIQKICHILDTTENIIGFVSPSHYIPQMLAIMNGVKATGRTPVFVYNTNGYDKVETLQMLEGLIDVYLPDFKYMDGELAGSYSQTKDYAEVACAALKEMYRQKGATLIVNDKGVAESGLIIRHLVLPGAVDQSIEVLRYIAHEISPKIHISLMSQYYPTEKVSGHAVLGRNISSREYKLVVDAFHDLGFYRGWIQELDSHANYRPDFSSKQPFREDSL